MIFAFTRRRLVSFDLRRESIGERALYLFNRKLLD